MDTKGVYSKVFFQESLFFSVADGKVPFFCFFGDKGDTSVVFLQFNILLGSAFFQESKITGELSVFQSMQIYDQI